VRRGIHSLKELLKYRELVLFMVISDLRTRYRGSFLGLLWTVLNPILMTCILWVVFSRFGRIEEKNYALFLLSGFMVWTFFTQSVTQSMNSIIKNRGLMQQIYVPKIVFPIAMIASNAVNFVFFLVAYIIIAMFTNVGLSPTILMVIPVLGVTCLLAAGFGLAIAALNVFFRDFTHLTDVILRALFYLTPILYPPDIFGETVSTILRLNPVYYPVVLTRDALYYHTLSTPDIWVMGLGTASIVFGIGLAIFISLEDKFVYYA